MDMLKAFHHSNVVANFGSALVEAYIRFVFLTSKVIRDPADTDAKLFSQHPQIFAMWHGQFMLVPMIKPEAGADIAIIAARHKDANMLAKTLQRFGMRVVRGAGDAGRRPRNRGGSAALRGALRALRGGATFAMTADVPPGPARRAGEGIALLGKLSTRPIVPCAIASNRHLALNSWSAFTLNLPFSRLAIVVGDPVVVRSEAGTRELETARLAVERGLNAVTKRAYSLAGGKDPLIEGAERRPS